MFPETTLFGVLLVLAISLTLIFLLIRKPHFRFRGTPVGKTRKEQKSSKDKGVKQTPKTRPQQFGYLNESPENAPSIPEEYLRSAKIMESQVGLSTPPTLPHKEETPEKPTSIVQTAETPKKPSEPVEAPKVIEEKRVPTPSARPQLRPPNCSHFFGYLRKVPKNVAMPDECFGCPKMVECLYYNAAPE